MHKLLRLYCEDSVCFDSLTEARKLIHYKQLRLATEARIKKSFYSNNFATVIIC